MDRACAVHGVREIHAKLSLKKLMQIDHLWNQGKIILKKGFSGRSYEDVKWTELA
jgi:hypothetical protein